MKNLIILGVVAMAAYWYYQSVYLPGQGTPLEEQWQQNAKLLDGPPVIGTIGSCSERTSETSSRVRYFAGSDIEWPR